jgi:hypothetical protein
MLEEKILQDRSELIAIFAKWSDDEEKILVYENDDTLVLKKMRRRVSCFADDSYNDQMTMDEVVNEVHKNRNL